MKIDLNPNEVVIKASDSHQLDNNQKIDGKFIVTNQRIHFIIKQSQNGHKNLEILPSELKEVIFIKGTSLFSKGLQIHLKNDCCYSFVMKNRNEFGKLINSMY